MVADMLSVVDVDVCAPEPVGRLAALAVERSASLIGPTMASSRGAVCSGTQFSGGDGNCTAPTVQARAGGHGAQVNTAADDEA